MNKPTFEKIKRMFNQEDLYCTFDLNKKTVTVEISEGVAKAKADAISEAKEEIKRLVKSFKLTEETLEVCEGGALVLNTVEFTALELKNAFSKSKLEGLMKATERGLEVKGLEFGLPLKARFNRDMSDNTEVFRDTLKKAHSKGLITQDFTKGIKGGDDGMFMVLDFS